MNAGKAESYNVKLETDIDLKGAEWEPIGPLSDYSTYKSSYKYFMKCK